MPFDGGTITARLGLDRKGFDRGLKGAQTNARKWDRAMGNLFKGGLMVSGLAIATRQVFRFADSSARLVDMSNAFDRLAEREGIASEQIINDVKGITSALSRRQIMETGNMLDLLGVGVQQLPKFTRIAQAAGVALNRTTSSMLESLSVGTARQSKLWLDNLGILISIEESNAKYARQIGITTGAMTDQQQRAAFLNAVLEKGDDIIKRVSGDTELHAEKTASLTTAWQDAKDSLGEYVIESLKLPGIIKGIADSINEQNDALRTNRELTEKAERGGLRIGGPAISPGWAVVGLAKQIQEFGKAQQARTFDAMFSQVDNRDDRVFEPQIMGLRRKTSGATSSDLGTNVERLADLQANPPFTRPITPIPGPDSTLNMSQLEVVKAWKEVKLTTDEIKTAHEDYAESFDKILSTLTKEDKRIAEQFAKLAKAGPVGQPATGDIGGSGDPRQQMLEARQRRLEQEAEATRAANEELSNFIRGVDDGGKSVAGLSRNIMSLGNAADMAAPILHGTKGAFPADLTGTGQPRDLRGKPMLDFGGAPKRLVGAVGPQGPIQIPEGLPPVIDSGAGLEFGDTIDGAELATDAILGLSSAFDDMVGAMMRGESGGKVFAAGLMASMSGVARNLGITLIQAGIGVQSLQTLQGAAAIAAGLGLLAISGIMGAGAASIGGQPSGVQPRNTTQPRQDPNKEPGKSVTVYVDNFIGKPEFVNELMTTMNRELRKGGNVEPFFSPA